MRDILHDQLLNAIDNLIEYDRHLGDVLWAAAADEGEKEERVIIVVIEVIPWNEGAGLQLVCSNARSRKW